MRSKLLKSFIYVFSFWWIVAAFVWSVADPETNLAGLRRLASALPFLRLQVPDGAVSVLDALFIQKQVFLFWSLPLVILTAAVGAIGAGVVWFVTWGHQKERAAREGPSGEFRGITISLGPLPVPRTTKRDILELGAADSAAFSSMGADEKALLVDILGIVSAHPDAYSGDGMGVSLLEHTVRVVEEALSSRNRPGLQAIVAAAHEAGKISAFKKSPDGEWVSVKNLEREAAKHLASLNSWWSMPPDTRQALIFAVRYRATPALLPEISDNPHIHRLAKDLLYRAAEATEKVAVVAKAKVLEKHELPAVALQGFLDALPMLPFQDGLPKGVKGVGWKVGSRVFLLEMKLRELIMAKLEPDLRAALEGAYKDKNKLATFTQEFLKAVDAKGWLVKEAAKTKLEAKEAMWVILAGKFEFKGVIIIDLPKEYLEVLPSKDSLYDITIRGPLYAQSANKEITSAELEDLGLFKKPSAPRPPPAAPVASIATE